MRRKKRISAIVCALTAALLLSGCYMRSASELYRVPKRSDDYIALQQAVEAALGETGTYCAPVSGSNQQAIQQADLDGDGVPEAIVYARIEGSLPLKIFIFHKTDGVYSLRYTLEGDGTVFDSVQYIQMDDKAGLELIAGRQVSESILQSLSVYSFRKETASEYATTNYTTYTTTDLDKDGLTDLIVLRSDGEERNGVAELYRWQNDEISRNTEVPLSAGADKIKRVLLGDMQTDTPAVFVASAYDENNLVTDVLALKDGVFTNISRSDESGISVQTVRSYYVYSGDIDLDGLLELPNIVPLAAVADNPSSENQNRIDWFNLHLDGSRTVKLSTYHNYADGWYLELPEKWLEDLAVTRVVTEQTNGFCFRPAADEQDCYVTIYAFSDENAANEAVQDGRFLLAQKGSVYYSAKLGTADSTISIDELLQQFHFISSETNSK